MSSTTENPTESPSGAAERLEHALERIALAMASSMARQGGVPAEQARVDDTAAREAEAVKARLDALIGKLRAGLAERAR